MATNATIQKVSLRISDKKLNSKSQRLLERSSFQYLWLIIVPYSIQLLINIYEVCTGKPYAHYDLMLRIVVFALLTSAWLVSKRWSFFTKYLLTLTACWIYFFRTYTMYHMQTTPEGLKQSKNAYVFSFFIATLMSVQMFASDFIYQSIDSLAFMVAVTVQTYLDKN